MVYSNTTDFNGIIQVIERECDLGNTYISGDDDQLKHFTARVNEVGNRVWHLIFNATGTWQYDDSNNSDLPQATTNLISGTAKYALPATALTVKRIEVKDEAGNWYVLKQLPEYLITTEGIDEFMKNDAQPMYYRLTDDTIEIFPASNYASTNGLKVYFDRGPATFATSDTTKTPGFASPYHEIIPIWVTIDWLTIKNPTSSSLPILANKLNQLKIDISNYYSKRNKDYKPKISRLKHSFK
jgi:VCBS repeat-containing protein